MAECLQDLLQCSICLERFTQPKVLPCQHTFCLSCLRGIAKDDKTLACPQCRAEHKLPKGGVQELPDNMTVKSLLNMFDESSENVTNLATSKTECFDCHKKVSLSECQHCNKSVCVNCRVSHEKLLAEIQLLLKLSENTSEEDHRLVNLMKKIVEKKAEIPEKLNELCKNIEKKLKQQERNLSRYLGALEKRVRVALPLEKKNLLQEMKGELSDCKTTTSLEAFKHLLLSSEKSMNVFLRHPEDEIQIEINCGECSLQGEIFIKLNDEVVATGSEFDGIFSVEASHEKQETEHAISRPPASSKVLPTKVDYESKGTLTILIDKHPDNTKTLTPDSATYSPSLETILCISKGQVLIYSLPGAQGGLLLPTVKSGTHIAVTDTEKVLVSEGKTVHIYDLVKSHNTEIIGAKLKKKLNFGKCINQICCYGQEFVVLTSNEKKMLIFSEEGQFIREFTIEKISSESRMTVDQEGRIYLTGEVAITEKNETGEMNGCSEYRRHSQLRVTMSVQIHVYSWTGQFISNLQLGDGLTKTYDYKFNAWCGWCCKNHVRNNNSLPDDQILNENLAKGLCVDGDGFLSIASNKQIQVYSQKPKPLSDQTSNEKPQLAVAEASENQTEKLDPVTSVGRHMTPGGGFGGELGGVSLMPDGRMIVCEKGANRIVIL